MNPRLVLVLALASVPGPLSGQASPGPPQTFLYVTSGVGIGSKPLAVQGGLSAHVPVGEFTLRWAILSDISVFGASDNVSDGALLYGVRRLAAHTWFSLGAGPAVAEANQYRCIEASAIFVCSAYERNRHTSLGLAFHATVGWAPAKTLGISVSLFGDANDAQSFMAATLNLHLGKLR
ncbi:MAG TPA: hypothetical protein VNL18_03910 [Gemmatimonadales bacterium]|nr:hypothetical protein [Gemmatimonadales bacterium]